MKIIVLTKNYGDGYTGATSATFSLINEWTSKGITVDVYTLHVVGAVNSAATVHQCLGKTEMIRKIRAKTAGSSAYVGYSDDHLGFFFRLVPLRYLHTYHSFWPVGAFYTGRLGIVKAAWFMPQYAATIYNSAITISISDWMKHVTQKFNAQSYVIRNGVELKEKHAITGGIEKNKAQYHVLMVGGIDQRKFGHLLKVLQLMPPGLVSRLSIDIYGAAHDQALCKKLRSFSNVHLQGFKNDIRYGAYDFFLTTSVMENLSIAVVEAIESGLPVIGFQVGALAEVVTENLGVLVAVKKDQVLAAILTQIVEQGLKFPLFDNSQVIAAYDWGLAAKKYSNYLEGI